MAGEFEVKTFSGRRTILDSEMEKNKIQLLRRIVSELLCFNQFNLA